MKIVINCCYGGFRLSNALMDEFNAPTPWTEVERTDERLIKFVEDHAELCNSHYTDLRVVEIPDSATDWTIIEDGNGYEYIVYVLGGKLHYEMG